MNRPRNASMVFAITVLTFILAFATVLAAGSDIPTLLDTRQAKIEIVKATFHAEIKGANATYKSDQPDKYRALQVTLKITKPSGAMIELRAADIVVQYQRGKRLEAAACKGLSIFSTELDSDRMLLITNDGSVTSSTKEDSSISKAELLYVDAVFFGMEPGTSEVQLLVAQPVGNRVSTGGWK